MLKIVWLWLSFVMGFQIICLQLMLMFPKHNLHSFIHMHKSHQVKCFGLWRRNHCHTGKIQNAWPPHTIVKTSNTNGAIKQISRHNIEWHTFCNRPIWPTRSGDAVDGFTNIFSIYFKFCVQPNTSTTERTEQANGWQTLLHYIECAVWCENVTHLPTVGQVFVRGLHLFEANILLTLLYVLSMNVFSWRFAFYPGRRLVQCGRKSFLLSPFFHLANKVFSCIHLITLSHFTIE